VDPTARGIGHVLPQHTIRQRQRALVHNPAAPAAIEGATALVAVLNRHTTDLCIRIWRDENDAVRMPRIQNRRVCSQQSKASGKG